MKDGEVYTHYVRNEPIKPSWKNDMHYSAQLEAMGYRTSEACEFVENGVVRGVIRTGTTND
jgi:hypothetical protein